MPANDPTAVIRALYDIAHQQNVEVSALSWDGFNIMGDHLSIREVTRLMACEDRLVALENRIRAAGVKL